MLIKNLMSQVTADFSYIKTDHKLSLTLTKSCQNITIRVECIARLPILAKNKWHMLSVNICSVSTFLQLVKYDHKKIISHYFNGKWSLVAISLKMYLLFLISSIQGWTDRADRESSQTQCLTTLLCHYCGTSTSKGLREHRTCLKCFSLCAMGHFSGVYFTNDKSQFSWQIVYLGLLGALRFPALPGW